MDRPNRISARVMLNLFLMMIAVVSLSLAPRVASADFSFEKVILRGEPAPDTEPGTVFAPLPTIYLTVTPRLDADGRIVFTAAVEGPAVSAANHTGIWAGEPGEISLVERAGTQADGIAPGGVYLSFPFDFALSSPPIGSGRFGITATLTGAGIVEGQNEGLWVHESGVTQLLVREGTQAAGVPTGLVYASFMAIDVNDGGDAFIISSMNGPGATADNDEGFWTNRNGALELLIREGNPAPGLPGITFGGAGDYVGTGYSFESEAWSNDSKLGIQANITGPGIDYGNNEALWVERAGGLTLLAREGDEAPGFSGNVTFGGESVTADFGNVELNALGQAAFIARVGGSNLPFGMPIFSEHTGELTKLVMEFDPAPGTNRQFGILTGPVLSDGGRIAFRAALSDGGQWPPLGIWWDAPGAPGEITALVVPGQELPNYPGVTVIGTNFINGFNTAGQLAFEATIEDGTSGQRIALLLAEPTGEIAIVVDTAEPFDVQGSAGNGSDVRAVTDVTLGDLGESGVMAIRLDFPDNAFGFYLASNAATGVGGASPAAAIRLEPSAPNPFGDATRISFELPRPARAAMSVYDASGRLVRRLLDEPRPSGRHDVVWDGTDHSGTTVASGVYWARLDAEDGSRSVRMVFVNR
jgi:FlgD Ig-like domain